MNERIQWRDVPKMEAAFTLFLLILTVNMFVATAWYPWLMAIVPIPAFLFGMWARVTWGDARENRDLRLFLANLRNEVLADYTARYAEIRQRAAEQMSGDDDE